MAFFYYSRYFSYCCFISYELWYLHHRVWIFLIRYCRFLLPVSRICLQSNKTYQTQRKWNHFDKKVFTKMHEQEYNPNNGSLWNIRLALKKFRVNIYKSDDLQIFWKLSFYIKFVFKCLWSTQSQIQPWSRFTILFFVDLDSNTYLHLRFKKPFEPELKC